MGKNKKTVRLTCYDAHVLSNKQCENKSCRMWMFFPDSKNCAVLSAKSGPKTLQEIGDIFGVTRMRICQIEKIVLDKLSSSLEI